MGLELSENDITSCVVFLIAFFFAERVAKDPIIKLSLFKNTGVHEQYGHLGAIWRRNDRGGFIYSAFHSRCIPQTATQTSTVMIPMMLGVVVSSQIGGRVVTKFRYRDVMLVSALMLIIGISLLGFVMDSSSSRLVISLFMIIVGLGIGVSFSLLNISTLNAVPPQYKGTSSSLITFFRTIGSALGITVFGAIQKSDFNRVSEIYLI